MSGIISFESKGNFDKLDKYLNKLKNVVDPKRFEKYGERGVDALSKNTPIDTGLTSRSWYYEIEKTNSSITISFNNSNIQNGIPIAIILYYGHATGNGGYVVGRDYIHPAIRPIFDNIADEAWKEVKSL